jgi:hypothetical protein
MAVVFRRGSRGGAASACGLALRSLGVVGVTTRKCQNCPVRENQTWTILGLEREIAPLERVKDAAGGIWSSFQGEKRPLDCLISIAKQSLCVDCRLQAP